MQRMWPTVVLRLQWGTCMRSWARRARGLTLANPARCRVFNMGGPQRLSRLEMASAAAAAAGVDANDLIASCRAADVPRGALSPVDIAMDSSRLRKQLGIAGTPLAVVAQEVWQQLQGSC